MERQNSPLSEETPLRNISSYFLLLILGILPVLISIVIHVRLGPEDYLRASAEIKALIPNWFKLAPITQDTTLFLVITSEIKLLQLLHSFVCMAGGSILFGMTIKGKNKSLIFMAVPYSVLALISVLFYFMNVDVFTSASLFWYNRFYLLFFDISVMHGALPIVLYSAIIAGYLFFLISELMKRRNSKISRM